MPKAPLRSGPSPRPSFRYSWYCPHTSWVIWSFSPAASSMPSVACLAQPPIDSAATTAAAQMYDVRTRPPVDLLWLPAIGRIGRQGAPCREDRPARAFASDPEFYSTAAILYVRRACRSRLLLAGY